MEIRPQDYIITAQPFSITKTGLDWRSYYKDITRFPPVYRPYKNVQEALNRLSNANPLVTANIRKGHFPVFICTGDLQDDGSFVGGAVFEYWFRNGQNESDLVLKNSSDQAAFDFAGLSGHIAALQQLGEEEAAARELADQQILAASKNPANITQEAAYEFVTQEQKVFWNAKVNGEDVYTREQADNRYLQSFTESDPVFAASPAGSITTGQKANWNTAYGWGNHAGLYRPYNYVPTFAEVSAKPTTVSGYGITDAVQTDSAVNVLSLTVRGAAVYAKLGKDAGGFGGIYANNGVLELLSPSGTGYIMLPPSNVTYPGESWVYIPYGGGFGRYLAISVNNNFADINGNITVVAQQTPWVSDVNAAGFTLSGSTASGGSLTLASTTNAVKGKVFFSANAYYDAANERFDTGAGGYRIKRNDNTANYASWTYSTGGNLKATNSIQLTTGQDFIYSGASTAAYIQLVAGTTSIGNVWVVNNNNIGFSYTQAAWAPISTNYISKLLAFNGTIASVTAGITPQLHGLTTVLTDNGTNNTALLGVLSDVSGGTNTAGRRYAAILIGNVGIGTSAPTASLHVKAGTATAGTAPLKLTTGTALTTPEDGAMEYHTSHLYFTVGSIRTQIDTSESGELTYAGTATWNGTPPTGTPTHTYQWTQAGKMVTLRINLKYTTPGASNTTLELTLPGDCPAPLIPSGFSIASGSLIRGNGGFSSLITGVAQSAIFTTYLKRDPANTGNLIGVYSNAATGALVAYVTVTYWTT